MTSLISDTNKDLLNAVLNDMHDTFKRTITVFQEAKRVVITTSPEYNSLYKRNREEDSVSTESLGRDIEARIFYYTKGQDLQSIGVTNDDQLQLKLSDGDVRIKILATDFPLFKGVERIELDGAPYSINSSARPHGIIDSIFYTLILKKLD